MITTIVIAAGYIWNRDVSRSTRHTHCVIYTLASHCCTPFQLNNGKYHVRAQVEINLRSITPYRRTPRKQSGRDSKNDFT